MLADVWLRMRSLVARQRVEAEMDEELAFHLERLTQRYREAGLSPADADRQARLEFGGLELIKDEYRDARGVRLAEQLWRDTRLACRRLAAAPLFTLFAISSLSIGVALTTAAYSIIHSILLRDLGIHAPASLAFVVTPYESGFLQGLVSESDFERLRQTQTAFTTMAASETRGIPVSSPTLSELAAVEAVSSDYFETLGIQIHLGRAIQRPDTDAAAAVAVISEELWRTRLQRDPGVIGTTIRMAERPYEIIGIAASGFTGVSGGIGGTRLWIPLHSPAAVDGLRRDDAERRRLLVFGRLRPSITTTAASAALAVLGRQFDDSAPTALTASGVRRASERQWRALTAQEYASNDTVHHRVGVLLIALVGLLLAVACTNLANLMLARGATRQREIAIRCALGASRARLVAEQCIESALIAGAGAIAAASLFVVLQRTLRADFPIMLPNGRPWLIVVQPMLSPDALVISVLALGVSLLIFGLEPALRLTRALNVMQALQTGTPVGRPLIGRQRMLIRWQVAAATGFFVLATMFVRFTVESALHDSGVALDEVALAVLDFRANNSANAIGSRDALERIEAAAQASGRLRATAIATSLPFGFASAGQLSVALDASATAQKATAVVGTPAIFESLGIPLVRGRGFDARDTGANVTVISAFTARTLFGTIEAVGRHLTLINRPGSPVATVIGVAADTDVGRVFMPPSLCVYLPKPADDSLRTIVVARGRTDATTAVQTLREILEASHASPALQRIDTARTLLTGPYQLLRAAATSSVALGLITLAMSLVGLYGIQSHLVTFRSPEFGLRMALGSSVAQVRRMVLRDGLRPVVDGLVLGIAAGLATRVVVRAYADFEVDLIDPWTLLFTPVPIIAAAFLACDLPARSAAAVDPNVALRHA